MNRLLLAVMVVSAVGCGGPKYKFGLPNDAPDWVKAPPSGGKGYAFIGISAPGLTLSTSRAQAETRGRAGLARIVEARISQMYSDYVEAASEGSAGEGGLSSSELQSAETVSRTVSKQTLTGAHVKEYWTNPQNGETFAHTTLSKEDVLASAKKAVTEQARKDRLYADARAEQGLKELERLIDKEYEASVPTGTGRE